MNEIPDLHHAAAREVAAVLQPDSQATNEQLQAALANALNRIAALESDWEELGRIARFFHESVSRGSSSD